MSRSSTASPPLSTTTSPNRSPFLHHSTDSMTDDDNDGVPPSPLPPVTTKTESPPEAPKSECPTSARTPSFPVREDCWSEEATQTLIEAWGSHYLELNRGNLRQKHWQEVADAVNALHAHTKKLHRTDVQCKNRVDTVKKKYKIEKTKVVQSKGQYASTWPHFDSLDSLIGDTFSKANSIPSNVHKKKLRRRVSLSPEVSPSPPPTNTTMTQYRKSSTDSISPLPKVPWSVPVGPRSKRPGNGNLTERNFSVMAAAAAAVEANEEEEEDENENETWLGQLPPVAGRKRRRPIEEGDGSVGEGYRRLAKAITRLGEIYEKVEVAKQQQMVDLEKQRMQFAKDLEIQRMKLFMDSQVPVQKLKRLKNNSRNRTVWQEPIDHFGDYH
ncbi:trihelix transcription factor ASIL2-like [Olea europaea var. sylvestris]|uniref:trihelix transcription factor ASIL2-like n=1 Tax=Olea europaea var. sylvestris TaxID=158386 RepID=UPI000C1D8051|nr:trihelix transcription factor ASIL2-like [Olea europaea var. sylvestris]